MYDYSNFVCGYLSNNMKSISVNRQDITLLLLTIVISLGYFAFNRPIGNIHVSRTYLDDFIPLIPAFVIPYLAYIPVIWLVVLYAFVTGDRFKALSISLISVHLVSFTVYAFYQTFIPRPAVPGNGFFSELLRFIYGIDEPYSACPSLHSSGSAVIAMYFILKGSTWWSFYTLFSVIVVISTLLIKQHFVVDAISGVTLGIATSYLVYKYIKG